MSFSIQVFFPIIIMLLLVLLIIIIAISTYKMKNRFGWNTERSSRWLLSGYMVVLLVAAGLAFFIPDQTDSKLQTATIDDVPNLRNAAANGNVASIDSRFIEKKWKFSYGEAKLQLKTRGGELNGIAVFVEKVSADAKIEAIHYQTPTIINRSIDITAYIPRLNVDLTGDVLAVELPEPVDLKFSGFTREFPIAQFTNRKWEKWMDDSFLHRGEQIVYLRIPDDIALSIEQGMVVE